MAELYCKYERSPYFDRQSGMTQTEYHETIEQSTCLYVGNLSYYTTENQISDFFSRAGEVKRVVMGLDRVQKTPCGFCFVEFYTQEETEAAIRYLNNLRLDDRQIRLDRDPGFREGRQYGRGKSGGQVRDEYRMDFDLGRGGFGRVIREAGAMDVGSAQNAFGGDRFYGGGREGRHNDRREGGREGGREHSDMPVRDRPDERKRGREEDGSDDEGRSRRRRREGSESD